MQMGRPCRGRVEGGGWGDRGKETRVLDLSFTTTHNFHTSAFHKVRPLLKSPQKPTAHPCLRFVCAFPRSFHPFFRCHRPAPSGVIEVSASSSFVVPGDPKKDPTQAFPRCKKLLTGASVSKHSTGFTYHAPGASALALQASFVGCCRWLAKSKRGNFLAASSFENRCLFFAYHRSGARRVRRVRRDSPRSCVRCSVQWLHLGMCGLVYSASLAN